MVVCEQNSLYLLCVISKINTKVSKITGKKVWKCYLIVCRIYKVLASNRLKLKIKLDIFKRGGGFNKNDIYCWMLNL